MTNYYKELDLDQSLSCYEIRDQLTMLEAKWICREAVNPIKAQKKLELIGEAKNVFQDANSRKEYDSKLKVKTQERTTDIPINMASLNDSSVPTNEAMGYRKQRIRRRRRRRNRYLYRMSCFWGGSAKSYFAVGCVGVAVASVIFWLVVFAVGFGDNESVIQIFLTNHSGPVIGACFGFFFLLGGFPWGWILFWPLWRDFVTRIRLFFFSFLRWPLLLICCFGFGWINMLIHIPTIFRDLRGI